MPLVLTEDWPLGFVLEWGACTTRTLLEPVTSTMWHKGGGTDQKNGPCSGRTARQRKQNEGTKEGLHCKRLKRKTRKSSLAIPCAVYPVALWLGSFPVE